MDIIEAWEQMPITVKFFDREGNLVQEREQKGFMFYKLPYFQHFRGSALITSRVLKQEMSEDKKTLSVYINYTDVFKNV